MFLYLDMLLKPHLVMKLEMPCVKYHFSIWKHHLLAKLAYIPSALFLLPMKDMRNLPIPQ